MRRVRVEMALASVSSKEVVIITGAVSMYCSSTHACNCLSNCGPLLPWIQTSFVLDYSMTHVCILGNSSPQFGK